MPTGYTEIIERGGTFEEFVWRCTRAMGVCYPMREDGLDTPVPEEFEPSDYHLKKIGEILEFINTLRLMTSYDAQRAMWDERCEAAQANQRRVAEHTRKTEAYAAVLAKVRDWTPPTPDHLGLKEFMIEQIESSVRFEGEPYQVAVPPIDPDAWLGDKLAAARKDLAYHEKHHAEEVERTEARNRWIAELRKSVPQPKAKAGQDPCRA